MVIYSQRMAALLMLRGFVLLGVSRNKNDNTRNVFHFKESEEIKQVMKEISESEK